MESTKSKPNLNQQQITQSSTQYSKLDFIQRGNHDDWISFSPTSEASYANTFQKYAEKGHGGENRQSTARNQAPDHDELQFVPETSSSEVCRRIATTTRTVLLIAGSFGAALAIAIAQFILYSYLHLKRPMIDSSITFGYIGILGNFFYISERGALLFGLGTAYIQALWRRLRRKWTTAKLIDRLMLLPWTPSDLISSLSTVRQAPLEWGFAFFCLVAIPIALTFPNGTLTFRFAEREAPVRNEMVVPSVNLTYRSDESWNALEAASLSGLMVSFPLDNVPDNQIADHRRNPYHIIGGSTLDPSEVMLDLSNKTIDMIRRLGKGVILAPRSQLQHLVARVLRTGAIEMWDNPANDRNSSYKIYFPGPKLRCTLMTPQQAEPYPSSYIHKNMDLLSRNRYYMSGLDSLFFFSFQPQYKAPSFRFYLEFLKQQAGLETGVNLTLMESPTTASASRTGEGTVNWEDFDGVISPFANITCELGITNHSLSVTHSTGGTTSLRDGHVSITNDGSFEPIDSLDGLHHYFIPAAPAPITHLRENITTGNSLPDNMAYYSEVDSELGKFLQEYLEVTSFLGAEELRSKSNGTNTTSARFILPEWATFVKKEVGSDWREISNSKSITFQQRYLQFQARSISAAMHMLLSGSIFFSLSSTTGGMDQIDETIILETPFAETDPQQPGLLKLNITPEGLEQAFDNIVASLPSLNQDGWQSTTTVTITAWDNVYFFERTRFLLIYAGIFSTSLLFLLFGIHALIRNGVPASRGFLQIVATTSGSGELRAAAKKCSIGGDENFSEELRGLKLKFGKLVEEDEEMAEGLMAFTSGVEGRAGARRWTATLGVEGEVEAFATRRRGDDVV